MAGTILSSGVSNLNTISNLALISRKNIGYVKQKNQPGDPFAVLRDLSGGYLFNIEAENAFVLESDITDQYTETNASIQDHIALRPEIVTVQGFVAELNDILPFSAQGFGVQFIQSKLTILGAYVPEVTESALVAINSALLAYTALLQAEKTIQQSLLKDQTTQQSLVFNQFYQDWNDRALFTIQTPWNIMTDMAIQSLRAIQDAETRMITNFEIQFKKIRFVNTQTVSQLNDKLQQGRALAASSTSQSAGSNTLGTSPVSFSSSLNGLVA